MAVAEILQMVLILKVEQEDPEVEDKVALEEPAVQVYRGKEILAEML